MPNWCFNKLTISGSKESMNDFYAVLKSGGDNEFRMEKFHPIPEELIKTNSPNKFRPVSKKEVVHRFLKTMMLEVDELGRTEKEFNKYCSLLVRKYGFDDWYDWSIQNWGCKCDVTEQKIESVNNDKRYCISYLTAWSPNINFIVFLFKMYPGLSFQLFYDEPGMGIAGNLVLGPGKIIKVEYEYVDAFFAFDTTSQKHIFLSNIEPDEYDTEVCFIHNDEWILRLEDEGYTPENVENWDKLIECFNL